MTSATNFLLIQEVSLKCTFCGHGFFRRPTIARLFDCRPAGGNFTVQIATNRALTTYSYGGRYVTAWGDGKNHPDDYSITNLAGEPNPGNSSCIPSPNSASKNHLSVHQTNRATVHTQNETMAAGTVFAISYQVRCSTT